MRDDQLEPAWHLLPNEPEKFFGLESGYGRPELKRRYNVYVKRFKPDKHPAEFQRIRAAYEALDHLLRYGERVQRQVEIDRYRWAVPEAGGDGVPLKSEAEHVPVPAEVTESASRAAKAPPRPVPLHERLSRESPADIYRELKQASPKSPWHYFALGLVGDALPEADSLTFARWLLEGLLKHRHEPGLMSLLSAWLRAGVPMELAPKLLVAISKVVTSDRFYFLTEPVWDDLLRHGAFATFRKTLETCEANLMDSRIEGRLTFYVHLLRTAAWRADELWLEETAAFIEQHFAEVPRFLTLDVELALAMKDYVLRREAFLSAHPARRRLDHVLETFCTAPDHEADREFLECEIWMATEPEDTLAAFPHDAEEDLRPFFEAWQWVRIDVEERIRSTDEPDPSSNELSEYRSVALLLETIEQHTIQSGKWYAWLWWVFDYLAIFFHWGGYVLLWAIALVPLFWLADLSPMVVATWIIVAAIIGFFGGRMISNGWLRPMWPQIERAVIDNCYRHIWRKDLQQFVRRTHLPLERLLQRIVELDDPKFRSRAAVFNLARQDLGLAIVAHAQQYLS